MILDAIFHFFRRDPTVKRHAVKAISWRIVGTLDTMFIGFVVTGNPMVGVKIGALEVVTKIVLYYAHERAWLRIPFGQPAALRRQRARHDAQSHLTRQPIAVSRAEHAERLGHPAFTLWLTGLSGAGKSTLAAALHRALHERGYHATLLDGDNTRMGLNRDLNFSREGREENIRRVAEVARLFNESGTIVLASFISPYRADRERARDVIGAAHFVEVHVDASLDTCIARDPKGLYRKALAGEIKDFTGIDSPYEAPEKPDIVVYTDEHGLEVCVRQVLTALHTRLPAPTAAYA